MNEEIEKLKKERDAAIEAGLKLVELGAGTGVSCNTEWEGAAQNLKALRPKPERLRGWANIYPPKITETGFLYDSEEAAKKLARSSLQTLRIAVPMIEVRPLPELPEMEEWNSDGGVVRTKTGRSLTGYVGTGPADTLCETHNATIRAFKKWAEAVKKEVGDE